MNLLLILIALQILLPTLKFLSVKSKLLRTSHFVQKFQLKRMSY